MNKTTLSKGLGTIEFVSLMALLMSLAALSIDAMLPALEVMGTELNIKNPNNAQFIISFLFFGMAIGQIFYGPASDTYGRKPTIYVGLLIFILGCLLSLIATSFTVMLLSRFLQGLGVASTRIVSMAIVRDQYSGNAMAQIMSLIMTFFILVPALAPGIGQIITLLSGWREIFWLFIILGAVSLIWMWKRLPESLPTSKRIPLSKKQILISIKKTLTTKVTITYTLASGLIFGAFIGYLISSQQIFQNIYKLGNMFSLYFGILAIAIGCASFINSRLVKIYGMKKLTWWALLFLCAISVFFIFFSYFFKGQPPLNFFMLYMMASFSCIGILFGNFNSLAIEPLGDIAGVASSVISTFQNIISLTLATAIGVTFNNTIYPLVIGFMLLSFFAIIIIYFQERLQK